MKRIVIVEDNYDDSALLEKHIRRFTDDTGIACHTTVYKNGFDFLDRYTPDTDVCFMDIEMPLLDGLSAAKTLRERDKYIGIVFVTNLAQYAINGYEVGALDYILKPVTYFNFADKLKKTLFRLRGKEERNLFISLPDKSQVKIPVSDLYFIEKQKNYLIYHTATGEYRSRGTIKKAEDELVGLSFSKCVIGCIVNLSCVDRTTKNSVSVSGSELPISRQFRKSFMDDLMKYLGEKS